jgi:hypothetical protein
LENRSAVGLNNVIFQVLKAASMKVAVFWVVALCSLVEVTDVSEVLAASIIRAIARWRQQARLKKVSSNYYTEKCK